MNIPQINMRSIIYHWKMGQHMHITPSVSQNKATQQHNTHAYLPPADLNVGCLSNGKTHEYTIVSRFTCQEKHKRISLAKPIIVILAVSKQKRKLYNRINNNY